MSALKEKDVIFSGTRDGLSLVLNAEDNIEEFKEKLEDKLKDSNCFYSGANVTLEIRGAVVSGDVIKEVKELLEGYGLNVKEADPDTLERMRSVREGLEKVKISRSVKSNLKPGIRGREMEQLPLQADTIMVKRTLRAGQCVSFDGNVVIMGDVNPGAEIEATCDIVVWGALRGIAHAGSNGNTEAKVVALKLIASQLRIANMITRAPDGEIQSPTGPEVASIKGDSIMIEPWTS